MTASLADEGPLYFLLYWPIRIVKRVQTIFVFRKLKPGLCKLPMEALSVTASVIAVLQATEAVITICCDYQSSVKGSSWEVPRVMREIRDLRSVLQVLEELADKAETPGSTDQSRLPALKALCDPSTGTLSSCRAELEKLKSKLDPPRWSGATGSKRRGLVEALSWPLKKADTEKILKGIEGFKSTIMLAVGTDQILMNQAIANDVECISASLSLSRLDDHQKKIRAWLRCTDSSSRHTKVLEDRQAGTGSWLAKSPVFSDWICDPNSMIWLYGIPGCGKTVLCSTAIEEVLHKRNSATEKSISVAYFYFEFNDKEKQLCDPMLRSLIAQLLPQINEGPNILDALYCACDNGALQPTTSKLIATLQELVAGSTEVFILLDALDECKEKDVLMAKLEEMSRWEITSLHMLVTSRQEKEIAESLSELLDAKDRIHVQGVSVEDDIRTYVRSRILTDRKLKKWKTPEMQSEIETALVEKAGGMFQWVKCQIDALGLCLSRSDLRKALRSLPKDLDDTYARILQGIDDKGYGESVVRIIRWLAYSKRPMFFYELNEVITVDVEGERRVDTEKRLEDPEDLLTICSSLVTLERRWVAHDTWSPCKLIEEMDILQFAHFSILEYLESPRIHEGPARKFAIQDARANSLIAESCATYLLQFDTLQASFEDCHPFKISGIAGMYPLVRYATRYWEHHAQEAENKGEIIPVSKAFLQSEGHALDVWRKYSDPLTLGRVSAPDTRKPLVLASLFNLPKTISDLISEGADVTSRNQYGYTPLMLASSRQHEHFQVVRLLLDNGAEVNLRTDDDCTALLLASNRGHVQVVLALLNNGADIHAQDKKGETALIKASKGGHAKVVRLLLDKDPTISSRHGVMAFMYASYLSKNREILRMLLEQGIDANAEVGPDMVERSHISPFGTPLLQCLARGRHAIAAWLLENGADVNAQSTVKGTRGVALEHALAHGKDDVVAFLLQHGADRSLVRLENLGEREMRRYEEMVLEGQSHQQEQEGRADL